MRQLTAFPVRDRRYAGDAEPTAVGPSCWLEVWSGFSTRSTSISWCQPDRVGDRRFAMAHDLATAGHAHLIRNSTAT